MTVAQVQPGQTFTSFYGNGSHKGTVTVTRVTEHSIFSKEKNLEGHEFAEGRDAKTTVQKYLDKGIWQPQ